jgi:cyclohexa-1,5-dienecarbonyl-CoA hydratase
MSVRLTPALGGAALRLMLDNGKGNVVDDNVVRLLREAFLHAASDPNLRCVVLEAAGKDFSFGASVEEHRPLRAPVMLHALHALLTQMLTLPLPVLAAVRGRCLGGGLELVLAASRVWAHPTAKLGSPEVKLGVIAPAASALLPRRVGACAAEDLLITGRTVEPEEALKLGLIDAVCDERDDPADVALRWAHAHLLEHSRSSLRFAVRAARGWVPAALDRLADLERLYVSELMNTPDAVEGIEAFIARRSPHWTS